MKPAAAARRAAALALVAAGIAACMRAAGPAAPVAPPPEPPAATPGPPAVHRLGDPGAPPTPPAGDPTRAPLTSGLGGRADPGIVAAFEMGDLARAEIERGTLARAFELLDGAIAAEPELYELYVIRAHAFLGEGSTERARDDLRRAGELQPDAAWLAEIIAANGAAYEIEGRIDAALVAYRRALRVYSANQTAREALKRLSEP